MSTTVTDGNAAAAEIAYACSEVAAIYPITPASPMGELADAWSQQGRPNQWGSVPEVVELQSEGGAAGTLHGALLGGAMASTFTASQGLLLMLPNLYKLAGELLPCVVHVAARSVATHALSIFGDHSDVMAARSTGMAMLASSSVQEAHDLALVAHAATLRTRVPFLHFFDGFRTSHEESSIDRIPHEIIAELIDDELVAEHRSRALDPAAPTLRGTAQNPDVFFQAREAANPFHGAVPRAVAAELERFAALTGRRYGLVDYHGAPDAERVVVVMGSGSWAVRWAVERLLERGERVGMITARLYRPFPTEALVAALPDSASAVAVLDRTKEPGAVGEPLFTDVVTALHRGGRGDVRVIGGRYGLSSKEFDPSMAAAVFGELDRPVPRPTFTVGIVDDVSHLSLDPVDLVPSTGDTVGAVFYGLGSDGTVGANKRSTAILGERTHGHAQGYFVYDSKKSGSMTVSHLRFGPDRIDMPWLVDEARFVGVHDLGLMDRVDVFERAAPGATVLLNSPFPPDETWARLSGANQRRIIELALEVHVVDARAVAERAGLGRRVNTVLQTCFFALAEVLPEAEAIEAIKDELSAAFAVRGESVVRRNLEAVDAALDGLVRMEIPATVTAPEPAAVASDDSPTDFVARVTRRLLAGEGERLPVSALPVDGSFPTGTAKIERRGIARELPIWDPEICIECNKCALVCPHAAIRAKAFDPIVVGAVRDEVPSRAATKGRELAGLRLTIQVAPDDCTGCGVCVDVCPGRDRGDLKRRALELRPRQDHLAVERARWDRFGELPEVQRSAVRIATVKGSQLLTPLFEFSGACSGCGETPYLKLVSQLFGDRVVIANATGCSSIYGGNLPTTPWTVDASGRGPAWANSLFEDNAEFGLGLRLAADQREARARRLLEGFRSTLGDLADRVLDRKQRTDAEVVAQRADIDQLVAALAELGDPRAAELAETADVLVRRSIWIVGGDGWAYDIGFGGLDHVLASGRDVNVLVLDTEVYSNTGGQASKATPRAAVAKFAAGGKTTGKKDLGMIAQDYGNVFVAQIAMGANMTQTVKALVEAEAHPGPSLVLAYSPCIAHGIDMARQMDHQHAATSSGHWPLYRYDPAREDAGEPGLRLDSRAPTVPFADFARREGRFALLERANPEHAAELLDRAQRDIDDRWQLYEQMVHLHRTAVYDDHDDEEGS
ncbi:MAG: pyruvate:ferredoxin (flavodoxin) oxidoreductase [Actinomycetota bacterium]